MRPKNKPLYQLTHWLSICLYLFASLSLILTSFSMVGKAFYELYDSMILKGEINKEILDAISFTIIAIAVFDVGRYLIEEEVQREKELRSPAEARYTFTRFMVVIAIALSLEGLAGVFEAGSVDRTGVLFPLSLVIGSVLVMVGLGVYQRLSVAAEREIAGLEGQSSDSDRNGDA